MKIEIEISDPAIHAIVARILDQEEMTHRISAIRKCWKLAAFLPYEDFDAWLDKPHIDFSLTSEAVEILDSVVERLETDILHNNLSPHEDFDKKRQLSEVRVIDYELEYTLRKLDLDLIFKPLLLRAIVCNKVADEDVPEAKRSIKVTKGHFSKAKSTQKYNKVHFSEKLLKVRKSDFLRHSDEWLFDGLYYGVEQQDPDTKPEIERDREWYWLHKAGKSYLQIARDTVHRGHIDAESYRESVKKQVKRYEKFLTGDI